MAYKTNGKPKTTVVLLITPTFKNTPNIKSKGLNIYDLDFHDDHDDHNDDNDDDNDDHDDHDDHDDNDDHDDYNDDHDDSDDNDDADDDASLVQQHTAVGII